METILEIKGLTKEFFLHAQQRLIKSCRDISFSLNKGSFIGIVGTSGAGKSTVLRCIYRTYLATTGSVIYDSLSYGKLDLVKAAERQIIHLRKVEIGYVSQFLTILPRTTAKQHVISGALDAGFSYEESVKRAEEMLRYFKLSENLWDIYPNTFSGGEKLRLNLAHAMVKAPRLLLLDEPAAGMNPNETAELMKTIRFVRDHFDMTVLLIEHDMKLVSGICERLTVLNFGHMLAEGPTSEVLSNPEVIKAYLGE